MTTCPPLAHVHRQAGVISPAQSLQDLRRHRSRIRGSRDLGTTLAARMCATFQIGAQFTNVPISRAMLCAISLSSGNDSIPITEYPSSHGIR